MSLTAASPLSIQIQDPQYALSQTTKDGRRPDLTLGVWTPKGLYFPAHSSGAPALTMPGANAGAGTSHSYRLAVPLDTALNFYIASHDLQLADPTGVALPGNTSQQSFQHATGDPNPKSFAFTILGLIP